MSPKAVIAGMAALVVFHAVPLPRATPDLVVDIQDTMREAAGEVSEVFQRDRPRRLPSGG